MYCCTDFEGWAVFGDTLGKDALGKRSHKLMIDSHLGYEARSGWKDISYCPFCGREINDGLPAEEEKEER